MKLQSQDLTPRSGCEVPAAAPQACTQLERGWLQVSLCSARDRGRPGAPSSSHLGLPPPSAPACAPSTHPPSSSAGAPRCLTRRAPGGSSSAWITCMWTLPVPVGARTSCTSPTLGWPPSIMRGGPPAPTASSQATSWMWRSGFQPAVLGGWGDLQTQAE